MRFLFSFLLFLFIINVSLAQQANLKGTVKDERGKPIEGASVSITPGKQGTITDENGKFELYINKAESKTLNISFIGFTSYRKSLKSAMSVEKDLVIVLKESIEVLKAVSITAEEEKRAEVSIVRLKPKSVEALPSPFGDFTKILATLPGVVSNNELSSAYSVRGGNFDENLIYVNNIPIYRPFLVSNGQQEGLSFINTNLVGSVNFSSGGWQSKYGDKLSSVLNVTYKEPTEFGASLTASLLGGSAHVEGISPNGRFSGIIGARHKSARYLLNTLETQGQYLPRFSDVQAYGTIKLGNSSNPDRTKLNILTSYARNRYLVEPENRETEFGTFNQALRLFVAFEGREILEYDTYQGGLNLSHNVNDNLNTQLILSAVRADEREFTDVEGGYRLCDVDKNLNSSSFNDCVFTRGIGTNYNGGRNTLNARIFNAESRNQLTISDRWSSEFGVGYSFQRIDDVLSEFNFTDSSEFVINIQNLQASNKLSTNRYHGYAQSTWKASEKITTTLGLRLSYWDLNKELVINPRWQVSIQPDWTRDVVFKAAVGLYSQPPFYRELRDFSGKLNPDLKAQRSLHIVTGMDYNFLWWGRSFKFISELYYKKLDNVISYDVNNVKIRYYANNNTKAFASGLDLRLSGEFIKGTESWFSLGILNTREDVEGDGNGFIRRPTDQRVNLAVFFQDHIPKNETVRVNLSILYGSGLPFGPPNDLANRNGFNGDSYRRVDVGFSKLFYLNKEKLDNKRTLLIGVEVLNLLGAANAISYVWINDINNSSFAVPNSLSQRFFNVKATVKI